MRKAPLTFLISMLSVLALMGLSACGQQTDQAASHDSVLASINDENITSSQIDREVLAIKRAYSIQNDDQWNDFLVNQKLSDEELRKNILNGLVNSTLIKQAAEDQNIIVEDADVDQSITALKSNYPDENSWEEALHASGYTEESYREAVKSTLVAQRLQKSLSASIELKPEEFRQFCENTAPNYSGRKSSHILLANDDLEGAKLVLDKLKNGADFASLAEEYSKDFGSAKDGGNVGWDFMSSFVPEYQQALNELDKGEISDIVQSQYGYHIIKCTDTFNLDKSKDISLDEIPLDIQEVFKNTLIDILSAQEFNSYLNTLKDQADITYFDESVKPEEDSSQKQSEELGN
ncbi:MAG: peptidylprolyl isomerase [Coriobacteriia bacterium]|nr:peptidylprolyl isomerase [Coriobacteriia bacterium]